MAKRIITISREFGSGGRFIGEKVAKKLGIAYYDKNIINDIAEKSGLSPEYVQKNAELSPKKGLFAYAFAGRDITGKSVEDIVYEAQRKCFSISATCFPRDQRRNNASNNAANYHGRIKSINACYRTKNEQCPRFLSLSCYKEICNSCQ